ncbi:MAG: polymerase subunit beta [Verrucomicrobiota bacterium]|jgi:DNA polymerase-3 subunit beta
MKFTIETKVLADALKIAATAVAARTTLPILSNVKIEAANNIVTLSTTNLDIHVKQRVAAKVLQDGATTAPLAILSQLVNRLQATETEIEWANKIIEVRSGEVLASLETLPSDEFPPPTAMKGEPVECDAADIQKPFAMLAHAMSHDQTQYALNGINLSPNGKGTDFAATNRSRMAIYHGQKLTTESVIVPDNFVAAIHKIQFGDKIKVTISDGSIRVASENVEVTALLIEASYPRWQNVVPKRSDKAFSCGRRPLIDSLRTCAIFTERQTPAIQLSGKGKEIEVSQPGKATALVMGTELAGQPDLTIRLDVNYLIDALSVIESENVRIQLQDAQSPILIEDGAFAAVINRMRMPE